METRYLREILRLHCREGIERTAIASSLGPSYTTVTRTLHKAEANGGEELEALADPELEALFYPARPGTPGGGVSARDPRGGLGGRPLR